MKSFKQFREECGCDKKERKAKSKKKEGNVEVMPNIPDGKKGMTTNVNNESVFAGNYQGPLYAPHPDLVKEVAPPGKKYERMVKHIKNCLLYTSPSPRDQRGSRMPSSA